MFGIGNRKSRARSGTFAPSRLRGAALAGLGMLAWRWWRNRQTDDTFSQRNPELSDRHTTSAGPV